ncbi:hypothetical protein UF64_17955 [Thalassospira sp. HJ]|uniref:DUF2628 domain-containing protein n=1 Tax=Thalassospira sp. HJ TaxID=1616823 RepID=UPI0005CE81FC|nr:DUF2628 domain-containing protein [Thalassospira sp. HJ]KJE33623.1 hypothetical protein UF64_17955 [Thalassospira sp. HJ]
MKVYTVHTHPGDADPMENAILIREGFNFWAFLLSGLWALYHRLWLGFIGLVVVSLLCTFAVELFDGGPEMDFALALVTGIGFGLIANDLRRRKLAAKGWQMVDIIAGHDESDAEHRCFERSKNSRLRVPHSAAGLTSTPSTGSPSYP